MEVNHKVIRVQKYLLDIADEEKSVQYKFLCKQKLDNKKRRVVPYNVNNDKNMGSPSYYELYRTVSYYSRCYA